MDRSAISYTIRNKLYKIKLPVSIIRHIKPSWHARTFCRPSLVNSNRSVVFWFHGHCSKSFQNVFSKSLGKFAAKFQLQVYPCNPQVWHPSICGCWTCGVDLQLSEPIRRVFRGLERPSMECLKWAKRFKLPVSLGFRKESFFAQLGDTRIWSWDILYPKHVGTVASLLPFYMLVSTGSQILPKSLCSNAMAWVLLLLHPTAGFSGARAKAMGQLGSASAQLLAQVGIAPCRQNKARKRL